MECLDANVVQDLMAGALTDGAKATAIQHLDGCGDCRDLLGALARDATRDAALDTLSDTDNNPRKVSMFETLASDGGGVGMLETVAPADPLEDTGAATGDPDPATRPIRIRPPTAVAGTVLGRYTLLERLGAGAMGVVFRAEDRELGRDVALKQLHRPDEALTDRLVREARSMAQVNHPNVVGVYDVGTAEGVTYIAMELVSGDSLRAWQRERRTVPEIVTAYVAAGRGLAAAHAAGIVHRDFKPDNVLVGRDGRVRVTDFGLAASRPDGSERAPSTSMMSDVNLTTSGSVLGTPAYMAPEQFTGGHVDARTDQFNFCVALYEALYGQRPFEGKSFSELGDNVCEGRVRPAPPGARISRGLRAIIVRGLSVKPGDRYPTMDHLLVELGRDRARPWRRTSIIATALAVVLAIGLGADWAVRDRVSAQIRQSFTATAKQSDRAVKLLADQFDAISNLVYLFPIMRDVAAHHDQADFGLGEPAADAEALDKLHHQLASADWTLARNFGGREHPSILAVADYKARLLFTSAAPDTWKTDLSTLPWIKAALDAGTGNSMTLMRYDEPRLVATGLLGTEPRTGLAMLFTRTLALGEARSQFLQVVDAGQLLDQIRLDDDTLLSLVAADGTPVGDVPPAVVAAASVDGQRSSAVDGTTYEVQALPLTGFEGRLVMAQPMDGVLALFPHARSVFLIALLAALATALGTALRARRITGARVT